MSHTLLSLPQRPYRRIATEEAFAPPEMLDIYRRILAKDDVDVGFKHLMGFYMSSPSERAQHIMRCLVDRSRHQSLLRSRPENQPPGKYPRC